MSTCRYTSCHRLLPGVTIEIDWHDYLDCGDPRDWDWGDVRAFVHGREVPMGGTGLDDILQGGWERDGRGAFGFHDEMMRQLEGARDAALEARAEVSHA